MNAINPPRPGSLALAATAPAGLALVLAGAWAAAASDLPLSGRQGLCLDRPPARAPATGVEARTELEQLLRLSETRFLVLLRERKTRVDRWADGRRIEEERRAGGTSSAKLELVEEHWGVAIIDRAGKIRKRSSEYRRDNPKAPMAVVGGGELSWSRPLLLAMEESPTCSYAVLTRSPAKLLFFDHELAASDPVELPLEFVSGASLQREGNAFTVWLFGKPPRSGDKTQRNESPESPVALRLPLGKRSLASLPIHRSALRAAVRAQAKDREGQRLTVDDDTLDLVPFSDDAQQPPLRVIVRAAGERVGAPNRRGWSFFRASLGEEGLSALEPLPLWIEEGEGEAAIDERRAAVTLPAGSQLFDVEPFTPEGSRVGVYFHFLLPEAPPPPPSGQRGPQVVDRLPVLRPFYREKAASSDSPKRGSLPRSQAHGTAGHQHALAASRPLHGAARGYAGIGLPRLQLCQRQTRPVAAVRGHSVAPLKSQCERASGGALFPPAC